METKGKAVDSVIQYQLHKEDSGGNGGFNPPTPSKAGVALVYNGNEWIEQDGYGYKQENQIGNNGIIEWDSANKDNDDKFFIPNDYDDPNSDGVYYYKISSYIPTKQEIIGSNVLFIEGDDEYEHKISVSDIDDTNFNNSYGCYGFVIVENVNFEIFGDSFTAPSTGIYLPLYSEENITLIFDFNKYVVIEDKLLPNYNLMVNVDENSFDDVLNIYNKNGVVYVNNNGVIGEGVPNYNDGEIVSFSFYQVEKTLPFQSNGQIKYTNLCFVDTDNGWQQSFATGYYTVALTYNSGGGGGGGQLGT